MDPETEPVVVQPRHGNLHLFKAEEMSMILDVLIPAYDFKSRFCNFYEEKTVAKAEGSTGVLSYNMYPIVASMNLFAYDDLVKG